MQISLLVPFSETRLRRTLQFLIRPRVKTARTRGVALIVIGVGLAVLKPGDTLTYVAVIIGLWLAFGAGPTAVGLSVRHQPSTLKEDCHLALDNEGITLSYPRVQTRYRWTGIERIVETDEAWYAMVSKRQALTIPKDRMSAEQLAVFAAFVADLKPSDPQPTRR
ncbi:MAG TPA: YcxB family protein [Jiangellales bacterium]|nr:YcxB family protein [Jiangellales bacterium]